MRIVVPGRTIAFAAAVITAVALLTGCGSSEGTDSETDRVELGALGEIVPAAPVTDPPFTDADTLALRLLGEDDLPDGMVAAYDPTDESSQPASVPAPTTPAGCGKVLMALGFQRPEALTWTAVAYNGPEFASIDIDAASYADVGAALRAVQETVHNCTEYFGEDSEDTRIDYRLGALDQPPAGDASTSFQLRMTSADAGLVAQATLVQVGATLAQISVTAPEASDPALLAELTAAQVRALRGER